MGNNTKTPRQVIYICAGSKCKKRGGKQIAKIYKDAVKSLKRREEVEIVKTECTDRCKFGPVVCFQPQNEWFLYVNESKAEQIWNDNLNPKE